MCIPQNLFLLHLFTQLSALPFPSPVVPTPCAIFFIEQLDSLKNWSRNFCKNSVNALGIFMVNSSGEIRSILSFFISFSSHALFEMVQQGNGY